MEQVFDFREFLLNLLKKGKFILILALALGIIGGAYGFFKQGSSLSGDIRDSYTATAAMSTNQKDITSSIPINTALLTVTANLSTDYFYEGLLEEYRSAEGGLLADIFGKTDPTVADLRNKVTISTKGSLLFFAVSTENEEVSARAAEVGGNYVTETVNNTIASVYLTQLDRQSLTVDHHVAVSRMKVGMKYGILGVAAGLGVGILLLSFISIFSLKVQSVKDLRKYDIPILGELTRASGKQGGN